MMGKFKKPLVTETTSEGLRAGAENFVPAPLPIKKKAAAASPGDNGDKVMRKIRDAVEQIVRRSRGVTCKLKLWPHGIEVVKGRAAAGKDITTLHQGRGEPLAEGSLQSTGFWKRVRTEVAPDSDVFEARMPNGSPIVYLDRNRPYGEKI